MDYFLNIEKPLGRWEFSLNTLAIICIAVGIGYLAFNGLGDIDEMRPLAYFLSIPIGIMAWILISLLCLRRIQETKWPKASVLLLLIPGINILYLLALALATRQRPKQ